MIEDCPHCHTSVIAGSNRLCPSCRCDIDDRSGVNPDIVMVHLRKGMKFPDVCLGCGRQTPRREAVEAKGENPNHQSDHGLGGMLVGGVLGALFGHLLSSASGLDSHLLRLSLPHCEACAAKGGPRPTHVDFGAYEMSLLVHRNFKSEVLKANTPAS